LILTFSMKRNVAAIPPDLARDKSGRDRPAGGGRVAPAGRSQPDPHRSCRLMTPCPAARASGQPPRASLHWRAASAGRGMSARRLDLDATVSTIAAQAAKSTKIASIHERFGNRNPNGAQPLIALRPMCHTTQHVSQTVSQTAGMLSIQRWLEALNQIAFNTLAISFIGDSKCPNSIVAIFQGSFAGSFASTVLFNSLIEILRLTNVKEMTLENLPIWNMEKCVNSTDRIERDCTRIHRERVMHSVRVRHYLRELWQHVGPLGIQLMIYRSARIGNLQKFVQTKSQYTNCGVAAC
jgi:hypothetical protein